MAQPAASSGNSSSKTLLLILTAVISIGCLFWVLHDIDTELLSEEVAAMHWGWVAIAVISDIVVYFWHGWRWSLLLSPLAVVPFWRSVRAIYVGLFANEVLPLRTGEVIRCYLQGRWSNLPFTVILSSALIERIFDGIWLVICLIVTVRFVELPGYMVDFGFALGAFVILGIILLSAAMYFREAAKRLFARNRLLSKLNIVLDDLNLIGHSRYLYFSALVSLPYLLMQIVPIYALARGYPGLDISLGQAAALMVILRLGSVVPQAPGNLGAFQALTVLGLQLFGIDMGMGKRFSVVMWSVITLPLLISGFIALAVTGLKMREIQRGVESSSVETAPQAQP